MQRTVEPKDFMLAAMEGLQARIDDAQAMLEAMQRTLQTPGYSFAGEVTVPPAKRLGRPAKVVATELAPEPEPEPERLDKLGRRLGKMGNSSWTPAMRKAQSKRLKARWVNGDFAFKSKKAQPEQRLDTLGRRIPPPRKLSPQGRAALVKTAAIARAALAAQRAAAKVPVAKLQKPKKKTHTWTAEQRAKLSKAMKESAKSRGLNVRGEGATA